MRNQLLLLDDVDDLGRSGDIVSVKPGFARNFLIPQKKAVVADKFTLRMQAKLKEERSKRADIDRKESEELAKKIEGMVLEFRVKVDPDGNMYGSVTQSDIIELFDGLGIKLERRSILLQHAIKSLGVQTINLKLKEGIPTHFTLKVVSESAPPEEEMPAEDIQSAPEEEPEE
jgi:large subunit ribosomal protein L9